jgi:RNA polymerase sigma factor (sigma-70 family)
MGCSARLLRRRPGALHPVAFTGVVRSTGPRCERAAAHRSIRRVETGTVGGLVRQAQLGDQTAWDELVRRHLGLVHAVCRCFGLGGADAEAVNQIVWLRTAEHLPRFRSPEAVRGWIAAVARSESLRMLRARGRILHLGDVGVGVDDVAGDPDAGPSAPVPVLPDPQRAAGGGPRSLLSALARLDPASQRLLRLLAARPRPGDDEIGAALDLPPGAIGPARERSLARLRDAAAASGGGA